MVWILYDYIITYMSYIKKNEIIYFNDACGLGISGNLVKQKVKKRLIDFTYRNIILTLQLSY